MAESPKGNITPADYGAVRDEDHHRWVWWVGDQIRLVACDGDRPYGIQFFGSATCGMNVTELQELRTAIGKALKARKQYGESRKAASDE